MNTQQQELEKIKEELQSLRDQANNLIVQTTNALATAQEVQPTTSNTATALTPEAIKTLIELVLEKANDEAVNQIENDSDYIEAAEVVELELNYNNQIIINLNTDQLRCTIANNVDITDLKIDIDELMQDVERAMIRKAQA
jgi:hypothetical protein